MNYELFKSKICTHCNMECPRDESYIDSCASNIDSIIHPIKISSGSIIPIVDTDINKAFDNQIKSKLIPVGKWRSNDT